MNKYLKIALILFVLIGIAVAGESDYQDAKLTETTNTK